MHSEHLQNVRPSWVAFGWFVSACVTALAVFVLIRFGLVESNGDAPGGWMALAFFVGFFVGGWFTGGRTGAAPILHGVGIGLFSVIVWLAANLLLRGFSGASWSALSPTLTAGLLLLQMAAAAIGARIGSREARAETAAVR
ncbi:MAG TPA: hypothetical protein VFE05_11810 [Longimicrobiaceae bacterium]|jgi:hypothetical protein|nr:hypothetical protein [Longimicrobiaceae bacterium]